LRELEAKYCSFKWLKPVQDLHQITQGNFRGYFKTKGNKIIVVYFCRKVSQQARKQDIATAMANWRDYLEG